MTRELCESCRMISQGQMDETLSLAQEKVKVRHLLTIRLYLTKKNKAYPPVISEKLGVIFDFVVMVGSSKFIANKLGLLFLPNF